MAAIVEIVKKISDNWWFDKSSGSQDMEGDNPEPGGHPVALESSLLGVISWWLGRHTREEVLVLISRHFLPDEVREGNLLLAEACNLQEQPGHKTSILRSAGEAYAVDLVNNLDMLGKQKNAPRYLIPSDQLGKVPLGALNVRDEVSVGARLESLELSVKRVCSAQGGAGALGTGVVTGTRQRSKSPSVK